jgi:nicotinamidase/pyrazinamidase
MKALILLDIQRDFLPGGALGMPRGDEVIPVANRLQASGAFDVVVACKDWHPANHGSFAAQHEGKRPGDVIELNGLEQMLWPVHCVQETAGAEFAPGLNMDRVEKVFVKGTDADIDSYSALFDNGHRKATGLGDYLKEKGAGDVYLVGLATDVCVKFTALDACKLGFNTFVIRDGCRGVEMRSGDVNRALDAMREAGAHIIDSTEIEAV